MKNGFLKLLCVLFLGFVFVSSLEAHTGDQYVDGNVDVWEDSDGEVNGGGGGGGQGTMSKKQPYDLAAVVALKFSLVDKESLEVAGLYYYAYFTQSTAYGRAFTSKNNEGGPNNMCGLMIGSETSQWCTNATGKISYGESFFISNRAEMQIADDGKIRNWMKNLKPSGGTVGDGWGGNEWYHLYDLFTAGKLNVCSKAELFHLKSTDCADAETLRKAFQNMRGTNEGLQRYIIIAEPIYAVKTRGANGKPTFPYRFTTLKGMAKRMASLTPAGKYSFSRPVKNIHAMLKTNETHGEIGPYDPSFGNEGNYMTNDRWLELSDPTVGNNYNIWALNKIIKPQAAICEIADLDEDGVDEYYGIHGTLLDNEEQWLEECTCVIVDGKYYRTYPDDPITKEEFEAECEEPDEEEPVCPEKPIDYSEMVTDCNSGTEGYIKDPEMCRILDREEENYHTEFGNEYCEIYCKETLKFSFMDKETARAGRFFQHDVAAKYKSIEKLSTVILSTRECASTIDYERWKKDYERANDRVRTTWNEWKKTESQVDHTKSETKSAVCEGCSCEACCNCEKDEETGRTHCDSGSGCSDETMYWTNYYWPNSLHGVTDSEGKHTVVDASGSSLGSYSCSCDPCDGCDNESWDGTPPTEVNNYDAALKYREELVDKIYSCNFKERSTSYEKIMEYEPGNEVNIDYAENYEFNEGFEITDFPTDKEVVPSKVIKRGYSLEEEWENYCTGCEDDMETLPTKSNDEHLVYWKCTGEHASAICRDVVDKMFPMNRVSTVFIDTESHHYQGTDFYTQVYTGYVSSGADDLGYWIPMDIHAYPVGLLRKTGNYGIEVEYYNIGNPDRVVKFEDGEFACSYDVINDLAVYDCDDTINGEPQHECYDCSPSEECYPDDPEGNAMDLGVYFRTIDLSDVFPNSQYSNLGKNEPNNITVNRRVGRNWTTSNAIQVITNVQRLESIEGGVFSKNPQYSVKLRPSDIKKIQNYNKTTNYQDYSFRCDGLKCTSNFLKGALKDILENKYEEFYKKDTTIKGLYDYTK
jgi:hypothetical protein